MKTEIICITDRSGSMASIRADANGGFNKFIEDQKKVEGEARVTHVWFDDQVETLYSGVPLADVPPMDLAPRGMTSLYDALGRTLNAEGKRIKDEGWADLVIVTILTDGGENSSREYTQVQVKDMIQHAESHGWKFIFLAANQDAFSTASSIGIPSAMTRSFAANAVGTTQAYASTSVFAASLRSGMSAQEASLQVPKQ